MTPFNVKNKLVYILLFVFSFSYSQMNTHFVTTWKTDNPGVSSNTSIKIPFGFGVYNYDVDWNNDGIFDQTGLTGAVTHDFGSAGTYTIRIKGDFPHIYFNALDDKDKIIDVNQWGNQQWETMANSFTECNNLNITATDNPDLSNCTSLFQTFRYCPVFNGDISGWDTSNITNMFATFYGATIFNQNISGWNTTNVTTMAEMFGETTQFNQPITLWSTGNVQLMNSMFFRATAFNQNLNTWNTSTVTDMSAMFREASSFNGNISNWNVNSVQFMDFMFALTPFNQNISGWTTTSLTSTIDMFGLATNFNQDIGGWDVTQLTHAAGMFDGVTLSTVNYDALLSGWNLQVLNSNVIFSAGNSKFCNSELDKNNMTNAPNNWTITDGGKDPSCGLVASDHFVTTWKTDNPGTTSNTSIRIPTRPSLYTYFYDVDWDDDGVFDDFGVTGDITHTYASSGVKTVRIRGEFPLIYFHNSFDRRKILTVNQWGTQKWKNQNYAFYGCTNLNGTASDNPDFSLATRLGGMFRGCTSFNGDITNWNTSTIQHFHQMFMDATQFNQNIGGWNTSSATTMDLMFKNTPFNQDISGWDVSNVTSFAAMFLGATSFNQNINIWNVSNGQKFNSMFSGATSYNQPLNNWTTNSATLMAFMFFHAVAFNQDISNFTTNNVQQFQHMFAGAIAFNQDISGWNVSNGRRYNNMFDGATAFNQNIGGWTLNSSLHIEVYEMFRNATSFNQDIGSWNMFRATNFRKMFKGATSFDQDLGNWNVSRIIYAAEMFEGVTLSTANYDALLIGWNAQTLKPNVPFSGGNSDWCLGDAARTNMIGAKNWTITDGTMNCITCSDPITTTWNGANWNNGSPNINKPAIINGNYDTTLNGSFTSCDCTINNGFSLNINDGGFINVNNLTNNGSLLIANNGSFVQHLNTSTIGGTGYYKMERETTSYVEYDYTYWSSPNAVETIGSVFNSNSTLIAGASHPNAINDTNYSSPNYIYWFNAANFNDNNNDTYDDEGNAWQHAASGITMEVGKGYIAQGAGADLPFNSNFATGLKQKVFFEGEFNTGNITVPVFEDNASGDNFQNQNLIGNPYPSPININKLVNNNLTVLQGTFYFWTHDSPISGANPGPNAFDFTNNDYAVATSNGTLFNYVSNGSAGSTPRPYISSGQSIIANVLQDGNVVFNNLMRETSPNLSYRHTTNSTNELALSRVWLNLTNEAGIFRQLLVGFYENGTNGIDNGLDGERNINGNDYDFYSLIENSDKRFAIQTQDLFNQNRLIPLGIEIVEAGEFTISIAHFEGVFNQGQAIYLQDHLEGVIHNLSLSDYVFDIEATSGLENRFTLRFTNDSLSIQKENYLNDINVYPNPSEGLFTFSWTPLNKPTSYTITDVIGKTVVSNIILKEQSENLLLNMTGFTKGIYFVNFYSVKGKETKKVVLK